MPKILAMDESGNTQKIAAVCLVSIPQKELSRVNEALSIRDADPQEIRILHGKVCGGEYKYSNFRNAYRQTGLQVYDDFLKGKLAEIAKLNIQLYATVFSNPMPINNQLRMVRLVEEAQYLLHTWSQQNSEDAFDHGLSINVDQQVFPCQFIFEHYRWRGKTHTTLIAKEKITSGLERGSLKKIHADRTNKIDIRDANSKSLKSIQLSDMLVGCIRERFAIGLDDYYQILKPLIYRERIRVKINEYEMPNMRRFIV